MTIDQEIKEVKPILRLQKIAVANNKPAIPYVTEYLELCYVGYNYLDILKFMEDKYIKND